MGTKTTLIIPALNEGVIIGGVVRRLLACTALQRAGLTDVLVVDNGSDDDTAAQALAAGARVVHEPRRGYGQACLAGVMAATDADILVQLDGDGSDVPEDIVSVWDLVQSDQADLALGSRARGHAERGALTPQQRVGNALGAALLRWLYGVRVSDLAPLRAIRRTTLLRMQMQEMTYGWSTEMLAKAGRLGLRVAEVPVDYRRRAGGTSKVAGTLSGTLRASSRILQTLGAYTHWQPEAARAALFIVARLPVVGQTKTRLGRGIGHPQATALYRAFLSDLGARYTHAAAQDGYDLWWFYAAPAEADEALFAAQVPAGGHFLRQGAGDLGPRLWQGFRELAARGYQRIVVLSSDSPHVPAGWVRDAFAALTTQDVVIGPADDGGYYLLGQRGTPHDLFTMIPMSTPQVFAQTLAAAAAQHVTVAHLPTTFDIDEPADLGSLHTTLLAEPELAPVTLAALNALTTTFAREAVRDGAE
jgi:rSAM/selenodomain-associated transferase 1